MTRETLDYLLRLALREKENAALSLLVTHEETSKAYGEAAAAVKEILEERGGKGATR